MNANPEQWVEWVEPFGPNSEAVYCRVTAGTAIATMRSLHAYVSDQNALDDFVTVHWATLRSVPAAGSANP